MHSKCTENQAGVWMPMERGAKKDWSWVDWMRFLFYRQAPTLTPLSAFSEIWPVIWLS